MTPATEPLKAWRNARFAEEWVFTESGDSFDFTGYTGALEVRLYGAQAGSAKILLPNVTSEMQGVWIVNPSLGIIRVRIDQDELQSAYETLLGANEAGTPVPLVYDLRLTAPDGNEEIWLEGPFIINPGVTIGG